MGLCKKKINPLSPKRANFRYFSSCKILKNKWDYANVLSPRSPPPPPLPASALPPRHTT